jgi:hypothetical protein
MAGPDRRLEPHPPLDARGVPDARVEAGVATPGWDVPADGDAGRHIAFTTDYRPEWNDVASEAIRDLFFGQKPQLTGPFTVSRGSPRPHSPVYGCGRWVAGS